MREDIFWENLLKLFNRGTWKIEGDEIKVFSYVYDQVEKRYKESKNPPVIAKPMEDPIKKPTKTNVKKSK